MRFEVGDIVKRVKPTTYTADKTRIIFDKEYEVESVEGVSFRVIGDYYNDYHHWWMDNFKLVKRAGAMKYLVVIDTDTPADTIATILKDNAIAAKVSTSYTDAGTIRLRRDYIRWVFSVEQDSWKIRNI